MFELALLYLKTPEDAGEVTQDVLLGVYKQIDTFCGDSCLSSWICQITFSVTMLRLWSAKSGRLFEVLQADLTSSKDFLGNTLLRRPPDTLDLWSGQVHPRHLAWQHYL